MHFPRTRFVDSNEIFAQLDKIDSELKELVEAYFNASILRVAEEAFDVIQAAETFLLILQEKRGVDLDRVRDHVKAKNQARGYYGHD